MRELENKKIVVVGRTPAGEAALRFLEANGAAATLSNASEFLSQFGAGEQSARNLPELIVVMPKIPALVIDAARAADADLRARTGFQTCLMHEYWSNRYEWKDHYKRTHRSNSEARPP